MPVVGVRDQRGSKRCDRGIAHPEPFAHLAQRKPGGSKAGRKFHSLQEQIGSGDKVALQQQVAREIEPTVGNHIARGQEQSHGHGLYTRPRGFTAPRRGEVKIAATFPIYPTCARKTS